MVSKIIISGFLFLLAISPSISQENPGLTFGGIQNEAGYAICTTADDGYLLAGSTRSFGKGSWDGYVVKLNKYGTIDWTNTYGWKRHDHLHSIYQLDDGYLFVGHMWDFGKERLDIYLVKTDLFGNVIFENLYGTHMRDIGFMLNQSNDGGYLILGHSRGDEHRGDIFIIKTDENGIESWRNNYGTEYDDYAYSFVETNNGSIVVFGSLGSFHDDVHGTYQTPSADWILIFIDQYGLETGSKTFNAAGHEFARAIKPAANGGYYLFGSSQSYGAGSFDMLLMKVDDSGNELWRKTFGGVDYEYGMSMDINNEGDLYLFGTTKSFGQQGSPDYFLVKVNDQGDELWNLTLGGDDLDYGNNVISTNDNGCALIGQTKSFGSGEFDILMALVSKDGLIVDLNVPDHNQHNQFVVYPNPIRSNAKIKLPDQNTDYKMDIISINGLVVRSYLLYPPEYHFNVELLVSGLYFYRIVKTGQQGYQVRGKLIVR